MTSDAKIGLLLGLVFIFVIAFIINGLPNFRDKTDNNELTTNMISRQNNNPLGLPPGQVETQHDFNLTEQLSKQPSGLDYVRPGFHTIVGDEQNVRSITPLPENPAVVKETIQTTEHEPTIGPGTPAPILTKDTEPKKPTVGKVPPPKVYVVKEDDNLTAIAKKFYGPEQGNKISNITRIFQANRKLLRSIHEVYVGQKIIIPPLPSSTADKTKPASTLPRKIFEKVKSIGRAHILGDEAGAKQSGWYVVREGDNLWKIAAAQLGAGSRYGEISKLNANILDDEDYVVAGMRLKMPPQ
jgi:nucleoid-associated protein YgaU